MDQHKKDKIKARELDERITKIEKFLWSESGYAAGGSVSGAHNEVPEGEDSRKAREGAEAASDRGAVVDPDAWERLGAAYRAVDDAPAPETCVGVRLAAEDQVNAANAEFVREVSRLVASLLSLDEHDVTTTRAVAWIKSWYESVIILREQLRSSKETNSSLMGKLDEAQDRAYEAEQRESAWKRGWLNFVAEVTGKSGGMSFDDMTDWIRAKENTVKLDVDGRVHQTVAAKGDDRAGQGRAVAKPRVRTCGHCGRVNGTELTQGADTSLDVDAVQGLRFLLRRIGSWTDARWDQHLRHEFGDEQAGFMIRQITAALPEARNP